MIDVTITFRASKATMEKQNLFGSPFRLYDCKRFYVPTESMGDLIELCKQRGWEIKAEPVFTTSLEQIHNEIIENEWKEEDA
jgi:hypothetical protein